MCLYYLLPYVASRSELKQEEFLPMVNTIVDAMLKECRKEQLAYKQHALNALGDTLSSLDIDRFDEVYSIVEDTLAKVCLWH
jgi:hypothetical protein